MPPKDVNSAADTLPRIHRLNIIFSQLNATRAPRLHGSVRRSFAALRRFRTAKHRSKKKRLTHLKGAADTLVHLTSS